MYFGDSILAIVRMTGSSWWTSICKQRVSMYFTAWWSQPAAAAQGACNLCRDLIPQHTSCLVKSASSHCTRCLQLVLLLNSPTLELFGPSAQGLLRPYLKQILRQHSCVLEMAQSIGFNLSPPQMYRICQPMSTCHLDWSEGKARGQEGCNSWVLGWLNTSTFASVSFGFWCIMWHPVFLTGSTAGGLNHPPQPHGQNCWCVSASALLPLWLTILSV